jgi:hypothetical protein
MAIEILDLPIKNGDFPSKMALFWTTQEIFSQQDAKSQQDH